jgi:hypothetical protein
VVATVPLELTLLRDAHRRGEHGVVLRTAPPLAAAWQEAGRLWWAGEALLYLGAAHAAGERVDAARGSLAAGLALATPPPGKVIPPDERVPADWAHLLLVDLDLVQGRYDEVVVRARTLATADRSAETRFGAVRANAAVLGARGDHDGCHTLLNQAALITRELRSRMRASLVEGDRAILLALQGRLYEAIASADTVLERLTRATTGPMLTWGATEGAAVAYTLARLSANAGDLFTAQRMLAVGARAALGVDRVWLHAHRLLAEGAVAAREGDVAGAEAALVAAGRLFEDLGAAPGSALALVEQGRLAWARGLLRSARPLLERAAADFALLGQAADEHEARRLLAGLPTA